MSATFGGTVQETFRAVSVPEITYTAAATVPTVEGTLYVHTETPAERCVRRSNECAHMAETLWLGGIDARAHLFACDQAEMADLYALLADMLAVGASFEWRVPR